MRRLPVAAIGRSTQRGVALLRLAVEAFPPEVKWAVRHASSFGGRGCCSESRCSDADRPTGSWGTPGADTVGGALAASIGFAQTIDTTQATTDADDAQLNVSCGAPATDASIWYTITVAEDTTVIVDVSTSSYSAGVLVGVGAPGALELAACGPGTVGFTASAGLTYYVLAIDDQADGGGNGGTLNISFNETPPPPSIDVTVAPRGTFNSKTGGATLHGTYSCTDADFAFIDGTVTQQVGRVSTIQGSFEVVVAGACDGASHPWTADVVPSNGKFKGGQSLTVAFTRLRAVRVLHRLHRATRQAQRPHQMTASE